MAPDSETTSEKVEKNLSDLTLHEICCLNQDGNHKMKNRSDVEKGEDLSSVNKKNHEGSLGDDGIPVPEVQLYPPGQVCLEWTTVHKVGAGLANLGNTCFLNTVIQCLTYCPPLANYLLQGDHSTNCKNFEFCLMCELQKHMRQVFQRSGDVIKPLCIYQNLKYIADHFQFGQQEDAHEFLRFVIDNLWRSSMYSYLNDDKLDSASRETTIINHIFGGYNRSQVVCLMCNLKSDKYEHFMDFILDIQNAHSLEKAVEQFVKPELLENENAYKCPNCDALVPAEKTFTIHRPPNVATFQLKRFDYFKSYGKITKHISYPEKFDLRPYMSQRKGSSLVYKLNAVLVHTGQNSNSGHYYCYIRNSNGSWYLMDDAKVQKVSLRDVLNQQAYVLFYIRSSPNGIHFKKNGVSSVMDFNNMNLRCPDGILPQLSSAKKNHYFHNSSQRANKSVEDGCYSGDRSPLSSQRTLSCGLNEPLSELNANSINRARNDDESANVKSSCAFRYSNRRSSYTHKRFYNHKKVAKRTQRFNLQYKKGSCEECFIPWSCDSFPYVSSGFEKNYKDNRRGNSLSVDYAYSSSNGINCQSYSSSIEQHEFAHEYETFDKSCSQWNDFFAKRNFSLPRKPKVSRNYSFSKKNDFFISKHFIGRRQRCYYAISGKSNSIQHDQESLHYKFCRYNGSVRKKHYANNDVQNFRLTQENNTDASYCVPMFPGFKQLYDNERCPLVQYSNGFTQRNFHYETFCKNKEHHRFTDIIQSSNKHFPVRSKRNSDSRNGYFRKGYGNNLFWREDYSSVPNVWRDYDCRIYESKMKCSSQYFPGRMAHFSPQFPKFKNRRRS